LRPRHPRGVHHQRPAATPRRLLRDQVADANIHAQPSGAKRFRPLRAPRVYRTRRRRNRPPGADAAANLPPFPLPFYFDWTKNLMTGEEVLKIFEENQALLKGHFLLTSGLHSNRYLQCALVLQHPAVAEKLCAELATKVNADDGLGRVDLV